MNIGIAFALFFAGVAVSEGYNHIRRKGENLARQNGYKQGLHEEEIRKEVTNDFIETLKVLYTECHGEDADLPKEFFEKVAKDGKAITRLK